MPKQRKFESCTHEWTHALPFQMQTLLMTGMRGPDNLPKNCAGKVIVRYLRGVVLKPAGDWHGENDNDFMWGTYPGGKGFEGFDWWTAEFWNDHDHYPHHFIMHLLHCAEVIGYIHPDKKIANYWMKFYCVGCHQFHLTEETRGELTERLNDFGHGWHNGKEAVESALRDDGPMMGKSF